MAFLAILTELVVVDILVTGVAVGILQIAEPLPGLALDYLFPVALFAGKCRMFSKQRKMRFAVVEPFGILKIVETVAFRAIGRHLTLVIIVVTGEARFVQTQIRRFFLFQSGIGNMSGIVAFRTIQGGMHTLFLKSRFTVVKCFFIEIDQSERTPVMFVVTGRTVFAHDIGGAVESFMNGLIVLDFRMAGLAIVVGDLVAHGMAFGTIAHAFQIGMCIAQIAWRNLGGQIREIK
jgi:hypothetical protein